MPAFPALEEVVWQAECVRLESGNESTTGDAYCQVAYDLAAAWQVCSRETARQYANKLEWRDPAHPAHWLHVTQGSLANLAHMPARAQKALSKAVNKRIAKGSRARMRMDQSTPVGVSLFNLTSHIVAPTHPTRCKPRTHWFASTAQEYTPTIVHM